VREQAFHDDVDHGMGDVAALFVVTNRASPKHHPAEARSTTQRLGRHLEVRFGVGSTREVPVARRIRQAEVIISAVGDR
jgi:hypothetical protein